MRRLLCAIPAAILLAATTAPQPLAAETNNCYWAVTGSTTYYLPDGTIIEYTYYKWICHPLNEA